MRSRRRLGFTLVELLVVIAIIGVLAAIILASLSSARTKSSDAVVRQELSQEQHAAEFAYETYGTYDFLCVIGAGDPYKLFISAVDNGSGAPGSAWCLPSNVTYLYLGGGGVLTSQAKPYTPGKWAMAVQEKGGKYFCTDYLGNSISTSTLTITPTDLDCN